MMFRQQHRKGSLLCVLLLCMSLLLQSATSSSNNNDNHNIFSSSLPERIEPLVKQLATNPRQASLWRRLGKIQLDAGEFAEARRIFCHGASCCPEDEQLKHHEKVFQAFHHDNKHSDDDGDASELSPAGLAPAFLSSQLLEESKDLFLSFATPSIPESILQHPSSSVPPNLRNRLIHASTQPIIPKDCCDYLIQEAERTAKRNGWTKDRHIQAPTCDIPVFDMDPSAVHWLRTAFQQVLFPLLCQLISPEIEVEPSHLRVQDCFIVRYDANNDNNENGPGFASLKPHQDESLLSLTIALNDDYQDGGLYIASTQDVLDGPAGTVLCFAGGLVHGGYPVSKGTRWILTVFLYVDENQSGKDVGYTLKALQQQK